MSIFADRITQLGAPAEYQDWAHDLDLVEGWVQCRRGDWMMAVLVATQVDGKLITRAAIDCAEPCEKHVKGARQSLRDALICAKDWCAGLCRIEQVQLAVRMAMEEGHIVVNTTDALRDPNARVLHDMARYAMCAAAHSAIARADAINAVSGAGQCSGAFGDTALEVSALRIRVRFPLDVVQAALGL